MKYPPKIKILALIESIRPITAFLGLAGAYIGGIVADAPYFSIPLILAMIVVFFATGGSMAFNDYFDRKVDKISHPKRPIPSKRITARESLYFSIILFVAALIISFFINWICFFIVLFSYLAMYVYEVYLKNIGFIGNLFVAFLASITFTFGGAAVGRPFSSVLLSIITFFLFSGREILKDVQDVRGDIIARKTLPMSIGEKNAAIIGSFILAIAMILSPLPFIFNLLGIGYLIFISVVNIICIYAIFQTLKDINNAEKTVGLIRTASAIGVLAIIVGAII
jgi:geranylgeranylglycerol-phosphate geranylgeranyltransferase